MTKPPRAPGRRQDQRTEAAKAWRKLYQTKQWRALRDMKRQDNPLCERCQKLGRITTMKAVNHKKPHRGDTNLFFDYENLESLCGPCHDRDAQARESTGRDYDSAVGADGWPIDPEHPFMGGAGTERDERLFIPDEVFWPIGIRPSSVPLTIVCGPAAAGKSTYVKQHAGHGDLVIDLDDIITELTGESRVTDRTLRQLGLIERNRRLAALADTVGVVRAWFCTGAPTAGNRRRWSEMLRPERVIVLATPAAECIKRVQADPARRMAQDDQIAAVERWWRSYGSWHGDSETVELAPQVK